MQESQRLLPVGIWKLRESSTARVLLPMQLELLQAVPVLPGVSVNVLPRTGEGKTERACRIEATHNTVLLGSPHQPLIMSRMSGKARILILYTHIKCWSEQIWQHMSPVPWTHRAIQTIKRISLSFQARQRVQGTCFSSLFPL